jgi:acyl-CoA reductase-like NAD-dependent aldehyde dehydrogenase
MVLHYIKVAIEEGGRILVGGKLKDMPQEFNKGFWLEPTIVTNVKKDMKIAREEIFGPVLSVLSFRNEKEAVRLSNSVIYGLSGSVWTSDSARALRLTKALETGVIWVNSMLTGYPQVSVPPHKMSGTGVELGMEGLMAYCKQKSVVISYDGNAKIGWNI